MMMNEQLKKEINEKVTALKSEMAANEQKNVNAVDESRAKQMGIPAQIDFAKKKVRKAIKKSIGGGACQSAVVSVMMEQIVVGCALVAGERGLDFAELFNAFYHAAVADIQRKISEEGISA